jgi:hypothetical protein
MKKHRSSLFELMASRVPIDSINVHETEREYRLCILITSEQKEKYIYIEGKQNKCRRMRGVAVVIYIYI